MVRFCCLAYALLLSSCMITVPSQRTYPPELNLPADTAGIVFINYFDYTVPSYIKDRQEFTYCNSVKGFTEGLSSRFAMDPLIHLIIADTLARGFTVMSMQDSSFRDTVRSVCGRYDASLLIALDSVRVWMYEDLVTDDDDGSNTSEYYLYSSNFITLYSADGEVIERSTAEKSKVYKSRPAFLLGLLTFTPSLAKAAGDAALLSYDAGWDYAAKFYPFSENILFNLYTGGPFLDLNRQILNGDPELVIEPLKSLTASPNKSVARKATHNLSVVYEMMDNRLTTDQIITESEKK